MRLDRKLLPTFILAALVLLPASAALAQPSTSPTGVPDDVNDLAGLLVYDSSNSGSLYVNPSNQDGVINALGAKSTGTTDANGSAQYQAMVDSTQVTFALVPVAVPAVFLPPPTLICQNRWVKVWINARCVQTAPARTSACIPLPQGTSVIATFAATTHCLAGPPNALCVEFWRPWAFLTYYGNNFCGGPVTRMVTVNNWLC